MSPAVIDGGPGFDRVEDDRDASDGIVNVSLDGLADDGRAGEGDDLIQVSRPARRPIKARASDQQVAR